MAKWLVALIGILLAVSAAAEQVHVGVTVGDGSGGRVFRKWNYSPKERAISSVAITLRRVSGGNSCFVNLRYGSGGHTFDNGKRVYLRDSKRRTVRWNVGGAAPNGRPLVLNAYHCEVRVETADISYVGENNSTSKEEDITPISRNPRDFPSIPRQGKAAYKRCRKLFRISPPRVDVGRIKPAGNIFGNKVKVIGSLYGQCVQEAGYFEYGRLKQRIDFPISDIFQRREFTIYGRKNRRGEIKIYTIDGQEDSVFIDEAM
ncbi:MAG: hypothetical protein D6808_01515 [Candidatus Dadabacteria bacterium]|nr:MAG: hypothetical protein D6808_01515 [Candidatus Dadabacteria bacterium]